MTSQSNRRGGRGAGETSAGSRVVYSTGGGGDLRNALKNISLESADTTAPPQPAKAAAPRIKVWLDTKKRRGKAVTMVGEFAHNPQTIADIARRLKTLCGAGGTVEGREVVIQGDHRTRIAEHLSHEGYRVDVKK